MAKIDNIDKGIVDLLIEDGRMSCSEAARRLAAVGMVVSERSVRYRIERLVREGIMRVSAIANPHAVGYPVVADVLLEVEADQIQQVAETMSAYDCVSYVACSIGETDISLQVVAPDTGEVYRFVTEVIRKVPGVRKTTTSIVPRVIKDVYQWRIPDNVCGE